MLHPREAAQPERRRGAHPPGPRDAPCVSRSRRGDGVGGPSDGDRETKEAAVAASRVSPLAGPLPAWGRRGRWPGPGCLRAPGAAASAPAHGARLPSLPGFQECLLGVLGARDPSAEAEALGSNRPPTTDKLVVSSPRGRPSAERGRGGPGSSRVNPLSPVLRLVLGAQRPDPRGLGWASSRRQKAPALALLSTGEGLGSAEGLEPRVPSPRS